jgi:hypothetical protein
MVREASLFSQLLYLVDRQTVWTKHLCDFEPPGPDEQVLRYGPAEDPASWVMNHFGR